MVAVIQLEAKAAVRVLTLSSGRVNALDVEFLEELTETVRNLAHTGAEALVITGAGQVFSAGVDLNRVVQGGCTYTERLVPALTDAFEAVFGYPGPTVAAINGAAIAGGCVLACACDWRLASPDTQIGAAEVKVGVAFPVAALEVMRYACGDRAEEVLLGARNYRGEDAVGRGLVHRIVAEDLIGAAMAEASELGGMSAQAYANTKSQLRGPALARMRAGAETDREVRKIWGADQTLAGIADYVDRLRRR